VIFKIDFEKADGSIRWDFVEEVLIRKGFDSKLKNWIMIHEHSEGAGGGGKVCINVNGENGPYFITHRDLRQGDPLSTLLFNLAADSFSYTMNKAKEQGFIRGWSHIW
jgi:mannosylglycoprotein endo-beta-mannosidase